MTSMTTLTQTFLEHVKWVYGEEVTEEELKPLYRALRVAPPDLIRRVVEHHEEMRSALAAPPGEGYRVELERQRRAEELKDEFMSYGGLEEWVVLNEYAARHGSELLGLAEQMRAAVEVPGEVLEHAVWGLYYEWRWARAAPPSFVEVQDGKIKVKYGRAEDWVRKRFCVVSYRGISLWVYVDGAFRESVKEIDRVVRQGLYPHITEEHRIKGIVDEILFRLELDAYRDFPFNGLGAEFVPVENGVLWRCGGSVVLLPQSPTFGYTYKLPVRYDPSARCERIDKFISEVVTEENRRVLYEIAASCLLPASRYHAAYMLVGTGSNGKSTYLELLQRFLGEENVANVALQELAASRFKPAQLVGKLANIYADIPKRPLHETGMFKMLTGGDRITVEKKFKDPFEFENTARLIFSANELPEVTDQTYAFWRRWIVVQFPKVFPPNPGLINELTTPEELSGFLNEVLAVLDEIERRGDLTRTGEVERMMEEWMRRSNSVYAFVRDCVEFSPRGFVPKDEVYAAYVEYCEEHNYRTLAKNVFAAELMRQVRGMGIGRRKIGGRRVMTWEGIRLKTAESEAVTAAAAPELELEPEPESESEPEPEREPAAEDLKRLHYEVSARCDVCREPKICVWVTKDGRRLVCRDCRYRIVGEWVEAKIYELVAEAQRRDERGLLKAVLLRRLADVGDVAERKLQELVESGDLFIYRDSDGNEYVRR